MTNKSLYSGIPASVFKYDPNAKQNVTFEHRKGVLHRLDVSFKSRTVCSLFEYTSNKPHVEGIKKGEWFAIAFTKDILLQTLINDLQPASLPLEELKDKIKALILEHHGDISSL